MRARDWLLTLGGFRTAGLAVSGADAGADTGMETGIRAAPSAAAVSAHVTATRLLGLSAEGSEVGTRIRLHTDGTLRSVGTFVLDDPKRLVIDLFGLREAETPSRLAVGSLHAARIRVGRHPGKIQIVVDAGAASSPFEQVETGLRRDGLEVSLGFLRCGGITV